MAPATAITIGNFDGVHVGHVQLIRTARAAVGDDGRVIVLSFDPHPISVLAPEKAPERLSTCEQRIQLLVDAGADEVACLNPTREFLNQVPEEFLSSFVDSYQPQVIVEGPDFHFGLGRSGNVQTLRDLESLHGYRAIIIDPVDIALSDHTLVRASSSMIRWLIHQGRVRDAALLLNRPYEFTGQVTVGDQRGRTLGVPTANLAPNGLLLPADGIYAGLAWKPDGTTYPAAISIGNKPTFGGSNRVCEAHLLGYDGDHDDYGWDLRLQFEHWLRDQLAYPDVRSLVSQLQLDIQRVQALYAQKV